MYLEVCVWHYNNRKSVTGRGESHGNLVLKEVVSVKVKDLLT